MPARVTESNTVLDQNFVDQRVWRTDPWGKPMAASYLADDRAGGKDAILFRDENELSKHRAIGRTLCDANAHAISIMGRIQNYVLGQGFSLQVQSRKKTNPAPPELLAKVEETIDNFCDDNDWDGKNPLSRELLRRERRDGEDIVGLWSRRDELGPGRVTARTIEPKCLTQPSNTRDMVAWLWNQVSPQVAERLANADWDFGVVSDKGDAERVIGYTVNWGDDWDFLPTHQVVHTMANVDRGVKRGVTDFLPVSDRIIEVSKTTGNVLSASALQAAIAWVIKHAKGVTADQIDTFKVGQEDWSTQERTGSGATRTRSYQRFPQGTIAHHSHGVEFGKGPGAADVEKWIAAIQAGLREVGVRWDMPEFAVSGDASNNNYASILMAGSPFVKNVEAIQQTQGEKHREIFWKVLYIVWSDGAFDAFGLNFSQLRRLVELVIEPPIVEVRDRDKETARRQILFKNKIMSKPTWAAHEELDFDEEQENFKTSGGPPTPPPLPFQQATVSESRARVMEDCGTGAGGFKSGNTCSDGGGIGGVVSSLSKAARDSLASDLEIDTDDINDLIVEGPDALYWDDVFSDFDGEPTGVQQELLAIHNLTPFTEGIEPRLVPADAGPKRPKKVSVTGISGHDSNTPPTTISTLEELQQSPPIILAPDGDLIDGHHRLSSAKEIGSDAIQAITATEEDMKVADSFGGLRGRGNASEEDWISWMQSRVAK